MSAVVPSWRSSPLTQQPQAQCLRVGDLVGGDQPRAERVERLAALALVPLAAALELELALGDVVGDGVPGDHGGGVVGRGEVAGGPPDDDGQLDLVVGPLAASRGTSTSSYGPTTVSVALRNSTGSARQLGAGLGGVVGVVQPDADDLADAGERRARLRAADSGRDSGGRSPRATASRTASSPLASSVPSMSADQSPTGRAAVPSSVRTAGRSSPAGPMRIELHGRLHVGDGLRTLRQDAQGGAGAEAGRARRARWR